MTNNFRFHFEIFTESTNLKISIFYLPTLDHISAEKLQLTTNLWMWAHLNDLQGNRNAPLQWIFSTKAQIRNDESGIVRIQDNLHMAILENILPAFPMASPK